MFKKLIILGLFLNILFGADASIEIIKKSSNAPKIAILADSSVGHNFVNKFKKMVYYDFKVGSHFTPFQNFDYSDKIDYTFYASKNMDYVLKVNFKVDSKLVVSAGLYNVANKNKVLTKKYQIDNLENYPMLVHALSTDVNRYINAPSVEWMNNLVVLSIYNKNGTSSIYVADYTMTYIKKIISGGLNIFPKWADKKHENLYFTKILSHTIPTIYKYNVFSGKTKKLVSSQGMAVVSDVSSDGTKVLMTLAPEGEPDIYLYDTSSGSKDQLTSYRGIDVNANFVDNGNKIIFVSDRLGAPNIFAKNIGSSDVNKIVYQSQNNSVVTANGDNIVYGTRENSNEFGANTFNLYLFSTKSDYVRRLTPNGKNQHPTFSTDGRNIAFIKHYRNDSAFGVIRLRYNKTYLFPINGMKIQSIDW